VADRSELAASFVVDPLKYMDVCKHPEHLVMVSHPVVYSTSTVSLCRAPPDLQTVAFGHSGPSKIPLPLSWRLCDWCHAESMFAPPQNGEMIMKEDTAVRRWEPIMASSRVSRDHRTPFTLHPPGSPELYSDADLCTAEGDSLLNAVQLMHGSEMLGAPTRDTMGMCDPSHGAVPASSRIP
jgi:hypothetical protein